MSNKNEELILSGKMNSRLSVAAPQTLTDAEKAQAIANIGSVELEITYDDDSTGTLTVAGKLVND